MDPFVAARLRAGAYLGAGEDLSHLQLAARRVGADQLADRLTFDGGLPWSTEWLLPVEEGSHRTLVALRGPVVALWTVRGLVGAVAESGEYGVWELVSGNRLVNGCAGYRYGTVGATSTTGRHVLAAADDTRLRLWEALDRAPVELDQVRLRVPLRSLHAVTSATGDPLLVGVESTVTVEDWSLLDPTTIGGEVCAWAIDGDPPRLRALPSPPLDAARVAAEQPLVARADTGLVTGDRDGVVRVWSPDEPPGPPPVPMASPAAAACATRSDGQSVAVVAHHNQRVGVWDLVEGAPPDTVLHSAHYAAAVACVRAPGGPLLAVTGGLDGRVCVFDVDAGALLGTIVMPVADPLPGTGSYRLPGTPPAPPGPEPVRGLTAGVLPDGRVIAVTIGDRGWLRWWCPLTGAELSAVRLTQPGRAVACGTEGLVVATTGRDLRLYSLPTAVRTATLPVVGSEELWALAVADDLIVALDGAGRLHRYRHGDGTRTGEPLAGHYRDARTIACGRHPDGRRVAVSGGFDGTVRVWDLDAGTQLHRIPVEHPVYTVALADDGAILVGTHGGIGVLRLRTTAPSSDQCSSA